MRRRTTSNLWITSFRVVDNYWESGGIATKSKEKMLWISHLASSIIFPLLLCLIVRGRALLVAILRIK